MWKVSDPDHGQWCRKCKQGYELVQINFLFGLFTVSHGIIRLEDYTSQEKKELLILYGYQSTDKVSKEILAEIIFETYYYNWDEEETYLTYALAERRVQEIIGCKRKWKEYVRDIWKESKKELYELMVGMNSVNTLMNIYILTSREGTTMFPPRASSKREDLYVIMQREFYNTMEELKQTEKDYESDISFDSAEIETYSCKKEWRISVVQLNN